MSAPIPKLACAGCDGYVVCWRGCRVQRYPSRDFYGRRPGNTSGPVRATPTTGRLVDVVKRHADCDELECGHRVALSGHPGWRNRQDRRWCMECPRVASEKRGNKVCAVCGTRFVGASDRVVCSKACSHKYGAISWQRLIARGDSR